ncbi:MAG: inositol monophosphatase family protein [bacterium]
MSSQERPPDFEVARPGAAEIGERELAEAYAVALRAADRARAEILPRFRRVAVETKGDGSPVTEADREAERAIRAVLGEAFPEDAILGEELGATPGAGSTRPRRRWVIDPIDGTIAFSRGIPLFTTLIALLVDEEPVLGLIDWPVAGDRIGGVRGGGVWRGGERVEVSQTDSLDRALVCHGDPFCFDRSGARAAWERMAAEIPMLRGYTDAFGHLLVLSGAADAMVDCDLNPWDAAVTRVLAHEAGGVCWMRRHRDRGKVDLIFGNAALVQRLGSFF